MDNPTNEEKAEETSEDPKKLKQKIWMMASFIGPLGMTKRVSGEECYPSATAAVGLAQDAFLAGDLVRARQMGEEAFIQVSKCVQCLPKTARKLIAPKLKQMAKY